MRDIFPKVNISPAVRAHAIKVPKIAKSKIPPKFLKKLFFFNNYKTKINFFHIQGTFEKYRWQ